MRPPPAPRSPPAHTEFREHTGGRVRGRKTNGLTAALPQPSAHGVEQETNESADHRAVQADVLEIPADGLLELPGKLNGIPLADPILDKLACLFAMLFSSVRENLA